jgi:glycolate oxidase
VKNLFLVTLQGDEEFVALEEKVVDEIVAAAGGKRVDDHIAEHEWEERSYEFRARKVGVGAIPAEVIVPVAKWAEFVDRCYQAFEDMKMDTGGIIGMIADRSTAMFMPYYFMNNETLLGMLGFSFNAYLGDISAEYGGRALGLGVFFASNLSSYRDKAAIEAMKDIKTVLDPHDVMNPGHMLCGKTRFGLTLGKNLMGVAFTFMEGVKKLSPKDKTFDNNIDRFEFDEMEHDKGISRKI